MRSRPGWVIALREVRLLRQDPLPLVLLLAVPVVFIAFLKPVMFVTLVIEGFPGRNGSEQAVPGAAATFSLLLCGLVGLSFFREHGWGTWDRLRASPATTGQILVGKLVPVYAFAVVQTAWLFGVGVVAFDLDVRGSMRALGAVGLAAAAAHVAIGLVLVAFSRTIQQVNALANLGTALLAGAGGALVPRFLLPGWVEAVGPWTPTYWAMRGYRAVILDGAGWSAVARPVATLLAFAVGASVVALMRFSVDERKAQL